MHSQWEKYVSNMHLPLFSTLVLADNDDDQVTSLKNANTRLHAQVSVIVHNVVLSLFFPVKQ